MPSVSKKQHNLMAAVAKNPAFAKKVGIKQSVGEEFLKADKGKKFGTGGDVNYTYGGQNQIGKQRTRFGSTFGYKNNIPNANLNNYVGKKEGGKIMAKKEMHSEKGEMKADKAQDVALIKKAMKQHDTQKHKGGKGTTLKLSSGGSYRRAADGITKTGKTKGTMVKMCGGGKM